MPVTDPTLTYCSPDRLNNSCTPKDQEDADWTVLGAQDYINEHPTDGSGRSFLVTGEYNLGNTGYIINKDMGGFPFTLLFWYKFNNLDAYEDAGYRIYLTIGDNKLVIHGYNSYGTLTVGFSLEDRGGNRHNATSVPPYAPEASEWNVLALAFDDFNSATLMWRNRNGGLETATWSGDFFIPGDERDLIVSTITETGYRNTGSETAGVHALVTDFRYISAGSDVLDYYYAEVESGALDRYVDIPPACREGTTIKRRPIIVPTDEIKYRLVDILRDGDNNKTHRAIKPKMLAPRSPVEPLLLADLCENPGIFSYKDIDILQDKAGFYVDNLINNALHIKIKDNKDGNRVYLSPVELTVTLRSLDMLIYYKDAILSLVEEK